MVWCRFIAVLCVFMSLTSPAAAAERFALIIGNASYSSKSLPALANPTNDAALIAATLERAGFNVDLIMDQDLRSMKRAVSAFAKKLDDAQGDTTAFFYFSGHGFQANNLNYLAPLGADLQDEVDAEFEAMSVDWVLAKLEAAHDGANIIVLDACRNTALSRGTGTGLALMSRTPLGSFISYATAPGSTAADGVGLNSPYTAAIAREILRPGLAIEQAFKNVRRSVVKETRGKQVPWDYSSLTGEIVLVSTDAAAKATPEGKAPADTLVELQFWNDAKDSGSATALQAYLDRYPEGVFAALARDRLSRAGGGADAAALQALFARLTTRGLVIDAPTEPHEFYANARMHELQGDYLRARQDYLKFFAFDLNKVDPHYRFQNFLVAQEGRGGARQVYSRVVQSLRDPVGQFAVLLLQDRDARIAGLRTFIAGNPDFAPALFALAQDYSPASLGRSSLADKTEEERLLKRFLELAEQGHFLRHFYDQQLAAEQLATARERLAALSVLAPDARTEPVRLSGFRTNQGWNVMISLADEATEIFVEHDGRTRSSTGFTATVHPQTGQPMAMPAFPLPGDTGPIEVRISYLDQRGGAHGPFTVRFDPAAALVETMKSNLTRFPGTWLTFRDWEGQIRVYVSNLISSRCGLANVTVGVDRDTPNRNIALPPCDPKDPYDVPVGKNAVPQFFLVPRATKFVSVVLKFQDGTQSEVTKFPAP